MKKIKSLNEYFSQTLTGDSFNSSDGVFKVNYKAYSDLSLAVGRDEDPSRFIKDSVFQIGDLVKGNVKGKKSKIKGEVIESSKSTDGKSYIIKIQSFKNKKTYALIPGSIEFIEDRGHTGDITRMAISSRDKNAQNLRYSSGNIVWGSFEGKEEYGTPIEEDTMNAPMGTGWRVKFIDELSDNKILDSFVIDDSNSTILSAKPNLVDDIKNKLKAIESILEEIGGLTFTTCPKTVHLCIDNIHDMILNIKADFTCIENKIKIHREKWLNSYRSLGIVRELKLLSLHSKLLDNRYDMLIKTLALAKVEHIKNV